MERNKIIFLEARGEDVDGLWDRYHFWASFGGTLLSLDITIFHTILYNECSCDLDFLVCFLSCSFCVVSALLLIIICSSSSFTIIYYLISLCNFRTQ